MISMRARWRPWRGGSHRRSGCARVSVASRANGALRGVILRAADDRHVKRFMRRYGMRLGAARFVAERLDECVVVLRRLAAQGLHANTTLLGESVRDRAEAEAVADEYGRILGRLHAERLPVNVALKLTHLGLELDEELAYANVERVVRVAERLQSFVRIDMEQSSVVDATLRIYRRLREAGTTASAPCCSRTSTAARPISSRSSAPAEPPLREGRVPRAAGDRLRGEARGRRGVRPARRDGAASGGYAAVATHDERLVDHCIDFAAREGIPRDRFELQMLYGVRPALQLELVRRGQTVRVATPYGPGGTRT